LLLLGLLGRFPPFYCPLAHALGWTSKPFQERRALAWRIHKGEAFVQSSVAMIEQQGT